MPAIIVFSHLRWDSLYQRPQHILSHLAKQYPIIFIEEPLFHEGESFLKFSTPVANIQVVQPHTPVKNAGFHDDQLPHMLGLMRKLVLNQSDHIAWFYTPMALPLLEELRPRIVVYDCMDNFASLKNETIPELQRENELMKVADVVFTAAPTLYRAKRKQHPNVHCFPNSVDAAHFMLALDRANSHPAHREIPGPRLGYYGVIDERFDAELVGKVADAHPQWQIVLVGPVENIDPAILPQGENIHYMGPQPYEALPQFLAGWDVCMLPFAKNEATRFICPVKTLEYMAAELPIVSTPIDDIVDLYGEVVNIAVDAPSFVAACEKVLLASPEEQAEKVMKMRAIAKSTSWQATAQKMCELIESTQVAKTTNPRSEASASNDVSASINTACPPAPIRRVKPAVPSTRTIRRSAIYYLNKDAR